MKAASKSLLIYFAVFVTTIASSPSIAFAKTGANVYELRTYTTHPGKQSDALKRLELATPLFIKHGMKVVAFWTSEGEKDTIVYLLGHENREAATVSWRGFHSDPQWQKLYAESVGNGSLLNGIQSQFMLPTEFSPMK